MVIINNAAYYDSGIENGHIENVEYIGSGTLTLTTTTYVGHYLQITQAMAEYEYLILFTYTDSADATPFLWGNNGTQIVLSKGTSYRCVFIVKNPSPGDKLMSKRSGQTGGGSYMLFGIR